MTLTIGKTNLRSLFVLIIAALISVFALGLYWTATSTSQTVTATLAFVAGLSMIVLPCTLPLVFIIVPLSAGKGYKKGLVMSILFGLGLIITIGLYGLIVAWLGQTAGLDTAIQVMFFLAGVAAITFGLSELGLLKFHLPVFQSTPKVIGKQGDYLKSFFMGLFLGNAGVGCPNPAFYILLAYIATTGNLVEGVGLGLIHGLGRALPLIMIALLAILGVNIVSKVAAKTGTIQKWTGWALIFIGAFILINGLPGGHAWYEETFVHEGWNEIVEKLNLPAELEADVHEHEEGSEDSMLGSLYPWLLLALIAIPIIWYKLKFRNQNKVRRGI